MNYLIADSGSTKTSWVYIDENGVQTSLESDGINPIRDSKDWIGTVVSSLPVWNPSLICFYGAGCIPPYSETLSSILKHRFSTAEIRVDSDLLGAAHALYGEQEGIACILGTGSNSCLYDGHRVVENVSPLGYILGDEGSGAVLGKRLIGDLLKGQMTDNLQQAFIDDTGLTRTDIIDKVYRQPMANQFLASLVPFLDKHRNEEDIHRFLVEEFRSFFRRNVSQYHRPDLSVSFVGGVAFCFTEELSEAASLEGFRIGKIVKRPIEGMVRYVTRVLR